jgi:hypothetical protein
MSLYNLLLFDPKPERHRFNRFPPEVHINFPFNEHFECPCFNCQHEYWIERQKKKTYIKLYFSEESISKEDSCQIARLNTIILKLKNTKNYPLLESFKIELENIKKKYIWNERKNILFFYDFILNISDDQNKHILNYLLSPVIINELCSFI